MTQKPFTHSDYLRTPADDAGRRSYYLEAEGLTYVEACESVWVSLVDSDGADLDGWTLTELPSGDLEEEVRALLREAFPDEESL
jgi:hypothetical protein